MVRNSLNHPSFVIIVLVVVVDRGGRGVGEGVRRPVGGRLGGRGDSGFRGLGELLGRIHSLGYSV